MTAGERFKFWKQTFDTVDGLDPELAQSFIALAEMLETPTMLPYWLLEELKCTEKPSETNQ